MLDLCGWVVETGADAFSSARARAVRDGSRVWVMLDVLRPMCIARESAEGSGPADEYVQTAGGLKPVLVY